MMVNQDKVFSIHGTTLRTSSTGNTTMGKLTLDWCGYADDLLLVFDDIESLRQGIEILDENFRRYRLSINSSKTKTMIFNQQYDNGEYPTTIGLLRGKELDNVHHHPSSCGLGRN